MALENARNYCSEVHGALPTTLCPYFFLGGPAHSENAKCFSGGKMASKASAESTTTLLAASMLCRRRCDAEAEISVRWGHVQLEMRHSRPKQRKVQQSRQHQGKKKGTAIVATGGLPHLLCIGGSKALSKFSSNQGL